MLSGVYCLTDITGIYEDFNFSGQSGPVVSTTDSVISLKITSVCCLCDSVISFLHDFNTKVFQNAES